MGGDICAPHSTTEQDAIRGKWVRVDRDLNLEGGYISPWLVRRYIGFLTSVANEN
jgi:hypothetical protein